MQNWTDFFKSVTRPFIIIWGFIVYGVCVMTGTETPDLLAVIVAAVIAEYFGERAVIRLKENSGKGETKGDR